MAFNFFKKKNNNQNITEKVENEVEKNIVAENAEEAVDEGSINADNAETSESLKNTAIAENMVTAENTENTADAETTVTAENTENTADAETTVIAENAANAETNESSVTSEINETAADSEETAESEVKEKKQGFFKKLVSGLAKTRNNIVSGIDSVFSGFSHIDDDFYEEIEEILIMGDIGVDTTMKIIDKLKEKVKEQKIKEPAECKQLLIDSIKEQMDIGENAYEFENQKSIVLVIGVNGVGKTTSVGKLAAQLKHQNKKVVMAAADTFRAAAIEQLTEWAHRAGTDIIAQQEGADPAAVIYDAIAASKARKADVLICDTAGRLHNKKNLMEELKKIDRIIEKEYSEAYRETFIVLDGTTGQNAMVQAKQFMECADITGVILTKMDGTAKGGIAVAIQSELGIPVKYIGIGEQIDDLQKFDANSFVDALFDVESN